MNAMGNKDVFLNRIAQKLGRPRSTDVKRPVWTRHPWDHLLQQQHHHELVAQFEQVLAKLGGRVIRVETLAALPAAINSWLEESGAQKLISWQHSSPSGQGVLEALRLYEQGLALRKSAASITLWDEQADQQHLLQAAEQADVGFTIAAHGIAETGSIVLYNRGSCGRLVSLLPSVSVSVLRAADIVPRITQVLDQLDVRAEQYSCINVITGPSRSADIEMDLSVGVHGPGQLIIFLVEQDH
jgi:L-lactate dehydrogenase complex protein LldG